MIPRSVEPFESHVVELEERALLREAWRRVRACASRERRPALDVVEKIAEAGSVAKPGALAAACGHDPSWGSRALAALRAEFRAQHRAVLSEMERSPSLEPHRLPTKGSASNLAPGAASSAVSLAQSSQLPNATRGERSKRRRRASIAPLACERASATGGRR